MKFLLNLSVFCQSLLHILVSLLLAKLYISSLYAFNLLGNVYINLDIFTLNKKVSYCFARIKKMVSTRSSMNHEDQDKTGNKLEIPIISSTSRYNSSLY